MNVSNLSSTSPLRPSPRGEGREKFHFHGVLVISNEVRNLTVDLERFLPTVEMTAGLFRGFYTVSTGRKSGGEVTNADIHYIKGII